MYFYEVSISLQSCWHKWCRVKNFHLDYGRNKACSSVSISFDGPFCKIECASIDIAITVCHLRLNFVCHLGWTMQVRICSRIFCPSSLFERNRFRWVLPVCGGVFAARTIFGFVARYALRDVEWRWFQGYIHYQNFWWQLSLRTCRSRCLICCKFTIYAHPYVISVFLRYAWSFWDCLLTSPQFLLILVILFSLLLYNLLSIRVKLT